MTVHGYKQCRCGHEAHDGACRICGCTKSKRADVNPRVHGLDDEERALMHLCKGIETAALTLHEIAKRIEAKLTGKRGKTTNGKARLDRPVPYMPRESAEPLTTALGKGPTKLLTHITYFDDRGASRAQLGLLTGFTKSTRNTYAGSLIAAGLIRRGGRDFIATQEGRAHVGRQTALTPLQWLDAARKRFGVGPNAILELMLAEPLPVYREDLESALNYSKSTVNTYLGPLLSVEIIERVDGTLTVRDDIRRAHAEDQKRGATA